MASSKKASRRPMPSGFLTAMYLARNAGDPFADGFIGNHLDDMTGMLGTKEQREYVWTVMRSARALYAKTMSEKTEAGDLMGQCQCALLLKEIDGAESVIAKWEEELAC